MHRRNRINLVVFLSFLAIWGLGTHGFVVSQNDDCCRPTIIASAAYKSLQMFGLNFDLEPQKQSTSKTEPEKSPSKAEPASGAAEEKVVEPTLQVARFMAAGFSASTAILLISRPLRTALQILLQIAWFWRPRIVVFGYGPLGRAIARRFRATRTVTVVDLDPDGARSTAAADDGVLFVEGDGSDPAILRKVGLRRCRTVFVALDDDMASLDVAAAITAAESSRTSTLDLRLVLSSRSLSRDLADSQWAKLGALDRASIFDLPEMAAIRLCETARFDRVALEAGQPRTHVVVIGCGDLGEAVMTEVLLTAWRIALAPPAVTVIDAHADEVRARIEAVAPALFIPPGTPGALPRLSRPDLHFETAALTAANVAPVIARIAAGRAPITAIVVVTGRDVINVEIGMALERAMTRSYLPIAPVHVRLSNEYRGDTPDLGSTRIGLVAPFGSLESIVEYGRAFGPDPDLVARRIHDHYRRAKERAFPYDPEPIWTDLKPTLKASNRRLYRHAVQKLEDLGLQIRANGLGRLRISGAIAREIDRLRLDLEGQYGKIVDFAGAPSRCPVTAIAPIKRIERSAVLEHDRWMTERATDGWRAAASKECKDRDDARKLQNYMVEWKHVDEFARKYDTLLLWALTTVEIGDEAQVFERVVGRVWMSYDRSDQKERWIFTTDFESDAIRPTELQIGVTVADFNGLDITTLAASAASRLTRFVATTDLTGQLLRIRLMPTLPSDERLLRIVNAVARQLTKAGLDVDVTWRRASPQPLRIGFVGHRDLARVGGEAAARRAIERAFLGLAFAEPWMELIVGLAPGADRLAVKLWRQMGLGPRTLVFPFVRDLPDGMREYWTDEPGAAGADCYSKSALEAFGRAFDEKREPASIGHATQARWILEYADQLVALWDGVPADLPGGTADAVAAAKSAGRSVRAIGPSEPSLDGDASQGRAGKSTGGSIKFAETAPRPDA